MTSEKINIFIDINNDSDTASTCIPRYEPSETMSDPHINPNNKVNNTTNGINPLRNITIKPDVTPKSNNDNIRGHGDISHKCCLCSRRPKDLEIIPLSIKNITIIVRLLNKHIPVLPQHQTQVAIQLR